MAMTPREVHELFVASLGKPTTMALVRCAVRAWEKSLQIVKEHGFPRLQARDVLPHIRRAEFESRARDIVAPGISVNVNVNKRKTSSFVEISAPKAVVTALTRKYAPTSLPDAVYRYTRAEASQLSLFEEQSSRNGEEENDRVYGCFIYGGAGAELTMARVYFPLPGAHLLTIDPLDLLVVYAAAASTERAEAQKARPSENAEEVALELKRKKKEEDAEG